LNEDDPNLQVEVEVEVGGDIEHEQISNGFNNVESPQSQSSLNIKQRAVVLNSHTHTNPIKQ